MKFDEITNKTKTKMREEKKKSSSKMDNKEIKFRKGERFNTKQILNDTN